MICFRWVQPPPRTKKGEEVRSVSMFVIGQAEIHTRRRGGAPLRDSPSELSTIYEDVSNAKRPDLNRTFWFFTADFTSATFGRPPLKPDITVFELNTWQRAQTTNCHQGPQALYGPRAQIVVVLVCFTSLGSKNTPYVGESGDPTGLRSSAFSCSRLPWCRVAGGDRRVTTAQGASAY